MSDMEIVDIINHVFTKEPKDATLLPKIMDLLLKQKPCLPTGFRFSLMLMTKRMRV